MAEPKDLVDGLEQGTDLPSGNEERFAGYRVLGVPFKPRHKMWALPTFR